MSNMYKYNFKNPETEHNLNAGNGNRTITAIYSSECPKRTNVNTGTGIGVKSVRGLLASVRLHFAV